MNGQRAIRPSLWYLSIAIPFAISGFGLFGYFLWQGLTHITDSLTQVVVPGKADLTLKTPGTYTVFLEDQSVMDGRIYSTTESVSGLKCSLLSLPAKQEIGLYRPGASTTYQVGGRSGRSVLAFQIKESGQYEFSCEYPPEAKGPQAVVAVGTGFGARLARMTGLGILAMFGGMACGVVVTIVVVVMRERAKKSGQAM